MMQQIPRPEYPRPILERDNWLNLNGQWLFDVDPLNEGMEAHWYTAHTYASVITVPYTLESDASGQGDLSPAEILWYEREFEHPAWAGCHIQLNIGACDYWTRVFINGLEVGQHKGGYAPFTFDISHALKPGLNKITIRVQDSLSWMRPRGKQAGTTRWPIDYDGVTGIWQTVWLEPVDQFHITEISTAYDVDNKRLSLTLGLSDYFPGTLKTHLIDSGNLIAESSCLCDGRSEVRVIMTVDNPTLWCPDKPFLYDLEFTLQNGEVDLDRVRSYAGLREISIHRGQILLNQSPLYLRGILDQGYFPGGWYTAIDDEALINDIKLTKSMGFNLVRKHQKAEDPRYLYWAARLGLMVWAEMPSGKIFSTELIESLTQEWMALVRRDRGNPCVISWVPFNESWGVWHQSSRPEQRAFVDAMVNLTRTMDLSRPVIGNDGWEYSSGDLWTLHLYEDEHEEDELEEASIKTRIECLQENPASQVANVGHPRIGALPDADTSGLPILLTECGGIGFIPADFEGQEFAYGSIPENEQELEERFRRIANDIDKADQLCGFVWTQLTDIQQEINGVLFFNRKPKLPISILKSIFESIRKEDSDTN